MTNLAASTPITCADATETFVEQHQATIAHLHAFMAAVQNYKPGLAGANSALQEAVRPLRLPSTVNMANAIEWALRAIETEEKALALEQQKEAALTALKAAERQRRQAERQALQARKAWAALTAPSKVATPTAQAILRKTRSNPVAVANAPLLHLAA